LPPGNGKTPFLYRKVTEDKETALIFYRRYGYEMDLAGSGRPS